MKTIQKKPRRGKRERFDDVYRRVFLHCPHDLYHELREIARDNQCSLEFVVRDALERYVDDLICFTDLDNSTSAHATAQGVCPLCDPAPCTTNPGSDYVH